MVVDVICQTRCTLDNRGNAIEEIRTPSKPALYGDSRVFFLGPVTKKIKPLFHLSTKWKVGDGMVISFWYDPWNGLPLMGYTEMRQRPPRQWISLREALPIWPTLLPHLRICHEVQLTEETDSLVWRWTNGGAYSAKSAYSSLIGAWMMNWGYPEIWKCKAPKKVKFFAYLMIKEKNYNTWCDGNKGFELCGVCAYETAEHLFFNCPYARRVWAHVEAILGVKIVNFNDTMAQIWDESVHMIMSNMRMSKLGWT